MKKLTTEEFIKKAKNIHGDKYDYSKVNYISSKDNILLIDNNYLTEHLVRADSHIIQKVGSNIKNAINKKEFLIKEFESIHGNKYNYSRVNYTGAKKLIEILCKVENHGSFFQTPDNHKQGKGCIKCAGLDKLSTSTIIDRVKIIHGDKYDYSFVEGGKTNRNKITIINKESNTTHSVSPHSIFNVKTKCSISNADNKNLFFIYKAKKIHGNKYDYSKVDYNGNKINVTLICPIHGEFKQKPNIHLQGKGCPICCESKGEKIIREFLQKNKIIYKPQHKFNDCKYKNLLPFDFYLPDYNICIEFNGKQHYEPVKWFGGEKSFKEQIIRDKIKSEYCKNNNIRLIIIKYNDDDVNKKLNKLFNGVPIIT
jgi:hypothetical protein